MGAVGGGKSIFLLLFFSWAAMPWRLFSFLNAMSQRNAVKHTQERVSWVGGLVSGYWLLVVLGPLGKVRCTTSISVGVCFSATLCSYSVYPCTPSFYLFSLFRIFFVYIYSSWYCCFCGGCRCCTFTRTTTDFRYPGCIFKASALPKISTWDISV